MSRGVMSSKKQEKSTFFSISINGGTFRLRGIHHGNKLGGLPNIINISTSSPPNGPSPLGNP